MIIGENLSEVGSFHSQSSAEVSVTQHQRRSTRTENQRWKPLRNRNANKHFSMNRFNRGEVAVKLVTLTLLSTSIIVEVCAWKELFQWGCVFFKKPQKFFSWAFSGHLAGVFGGSIRKWGNDKRRCFHTQLIGSGSGARLGNRKLLPACLSPLFEEPDQYETQKTTPNRGRVGKRVSNFLHVTDYISTKRHFLYHETQTTQQTSKNKKKNCCFCRSRPHFHRFQVSMLNGCMHS